MTEPSAEGLTLTPTPEVEKLQWRASRLAPPHCDHLEPETCCCGLPEANLTIAEYYDFGVRSNGEGMLHDYVRMEFAWRLENRMEKLESDLTALRSAADASNEAARKYASELQHLCDAIIGGKNVTAPFSEVLEKANHLRRYAEARKEGA